MAIAIVIFSGLLTITALGSATAKLKKVPDVMSSMESVGVKASQAPLLAMLEIAGGLGLILGIWSKPLGQLSALALSGYFVGAVLSHLRVKHKLADYGAALGILLLALLTSYLQFQR